MQTGIVRLFSFLSTRLPRPSFNLSGAIQSWLCRPVGFWSTAFRPNDAEPRLCSFNPFEASRGFNRSLVRTEASKSTLMPVLLESAKSASGLKKIQIKFLHRPLKSDAASWWETLSGDHSDNGLVQLIEIISMVSYPLLYQLAGLG